MQDSEIRAQLPHVLDKTEFDFLGERYEGKVRDNYTVGDHRFIVASDRISAFDRLITTVPFKGQVLTQIATQWFKDTSDISDNHLIDCPDPNVVVVRNCEVLPVEIIIRGYLAGSAWRDYSAGNPVSGITLPAGLSEFQRLERPVLTPSTKAEQGEHDLPISEKEIVGSGLVDQKLWDEVRDVAFALFTRGQQQASEHGLILVDTKYEFGLCSGKLILVDEIHTLDSSRYWREATYADRLAAGEAPEMLDKEPIRRWLMAQGYKGDGELPPINDDYRVKVARLYVDSVVEITGTPFVSAVGDTKLRVEQALRRYVDEPPRVAQG